MLTPFESSSFQVLPTRGLSALKTGREQQLVEAALARAAPGAAEVVWASSATWADLQDVLLEGQWHVIHFIGHGDFDPDRDEGVLALTGRHGLADLIEASRLVDLLRQARPVPRLVVLNSCSGATAATTDLFSGTAAALVRGGVSAVVAMQYEISDSAAAAFTRGFYGALARGRGVDEAVSSGRVAIVGLHGQTLEWITPVLYLRGHDSQLFAVPEARSYASAGSQPRKDKSGRAEAHIDIESSRQAGVTNRPRSRGPSHLVRAFIGHTAGVHCVTFSPDGTLLASAGSDKTGTQSKTCDKDEVPVNELTQICASCSSVGCFEAAALSEPRPDQGNGAGRPDASPAARGGGYADGRPEGREGRKRQVAWRLDGRSLLDDGVGREGRLPEEMTVHAAAAG